MANLKVSEQAYPSTRYTEGAAPATPATGEVITYAKADGLMYQKDDAGTETAMSAGAAGAPTTADYLVGTANGGLSAEIVVGTTPGGELGGTWASPTVDATHSGSAHILDHTHAVTGQGSTGGGASLAPTSFNQSTGLHVVGGVITSTIDADQNNYAPTGVHTKTTVYFTSLTATRTITGYDAGTEGEFLIFQNNTAQSLACSHESGSSSANNRFRLPNGATLTIRTRGSMLFVYLQGRWCAMLN